MQFQGSCSDVSLKTTNVICCQRIIKVTRTHPLRTVSIKMFITVGLDMFQSKQSA